MPLDLPAVPPVSRLVALPASPAMSPTGDGGGGFWVCSPPHAWATKTVTATQNPTTNDRRSTDPAKPKLDAAAITDIPLSQRSAMSDEMKLYYHPQSGNSRRV